jgi:C1A family cysteine protease
MVENIKFIRYCGSKEDYRDYIYKPKNQTLSSFVDLREANSLVEDQSSLGSCTGQALTAAYELMTMKKYPTKFIELSEMFVYYNSRTFDNTVDVDIGATIKNGLKGLKTYGVCKEELWPYDIEKFTVKPSEEAYAEALQRKIPTYYLVLGQNNIIDALNSGYPVIIGIDIFESFMYLDKNNYMLSVRDYNDNPMGGHALLIVGYDLDKKSFLVQNSFGPEWGLNGYFYMTFEYADEYVFESWIYDIADLT